MRSRSPRKGQRPRSSCLAAAKGALSESGSPSQGRRFYRYFCGQRLGLPIGPASLPPRSLRLGLPAARPSSLPLCLAAFVCAWLGSLLDSLWGDLLMCVWDHLLAFMAVVDTWGGQPPSGVVWGGPWVTWRTLRVARAEPGATGGAALAFPFPPCLVPPL
jgi:hypothetical protein